MAVVMKSCVVAFRLTSSFSFASAVGHSRCTLSEDTKRNGAAVAAELRLFSEVKYMFGYGCQFIVYMQHDT